MDFLDEVAQTQPVNLDDLIEVRELPLLSAPEGTLRNRAASKALLTSDPQTAYTDMMFEAQSGETYTHDRISSEVDAVNRGMDMQIIMSILGDPESSDEERQSAIAAVNSDMMKDSRFRLTSAALVEDSETISGGETPEREAVRLGLASHLREKFEFEEQKQSLLNQNAVFADEFTTKKVVDFFAYLAPLSVNLNAENLLMGMAEQIMENPSRAQAFFLPGTFTKTLTETFANLPPSERLEVMRRMMDIIENHSGIVFGSENHFNQWLTAKITFDQGGYTTFDKWMDNATGVFDILTLGLFSFGRSAARGMREGKSEDLSRTVARESSTQTTPVPVAPANAIADANPQKARDMYELVVRSDGDEVALSLYGVNRNTAITQPILPQVASTDGTVTSKVVDADRNLRVIRPDDDVARLAYHTGQIYRTPGEKLAAFAHIQNNFYNAQGMHLLDNLTQVGVLDGGTVRNLKGVFGTTEGGFLRAEEAMDQALVSFRDFGVIEKDVTILQKIGSEYVPIKLDDVRGVDGDFVVQLSVERQILPGDIPSREAFGVNMNFFARLPHSFSGIFGPKQGSLQRWLVDPSSMFRPELSGGAIVGFDRAVAVDKALLKLHDDFGKSYKGLDSQMQARVLDHIKEANLHGLELTDADLLARGFNEAAIDSMKKWRTAWDTHFFFENADLVRSLRNNGYGVFENGNARFYAKPVGKDSRIVTVYDPDSDSVVRISRKEADDLYENGGTLAQLRRPVMVDGEGVEFMVVRNKPGSLIRGLTERDQVLNYRKGYYQRQYKAAKYVEHDVLDKNGNFLYSKVVAYSDNIGDAKRFLTRKATEMGISPEKYGRIRDDIKDLNSNGNPNWDMKSAGGRIAQKHRGKLLEDAAGPQDLSSATHVMDPAESAVRAARSLSTRVAMRDFLEDSKLRALEQYKEFFPKDQYGRPEWTTADKMIPTKTTTSKELADARSTVEYINYLETGYINSIDDIYKTGMNLVADLLGDLGATPLEKTFRKLGEGQPASLTKNSAFTSYLALNPLRQLIIQPHQSVRLSAYNPEYLATGKAATDIIMITNYKSKEVFFGKDVARRGLSKEHLDIIDFIEDSGVLAAVDRSNLVRGPLMDLAESSSKGMRVIGKPIVGARKVGYDLGEQTNLVLHMMTVRDKMIRGGADFSSLAVREEAHAAARNLSWDMNMGGDFPYNQAWPSFILQFAQIPHKAIMQYASRKISAKDKAKLAVIDMMLFGVPGAAVISQFVGEDVLPEDKQMRDAMLFGMETVILNKAFSQIAGRDVNFDFSALSPFQLDGWGGVLTAFLEGGMGTIFNESPASNILWKEGSKVREAFLTASRYFGHFDPFEGHEPAEIKDVLSALADLSSGWTNYQKAKLIYQTSKVMDKQGNTLKENAGLMEAALQMFGFSSQESMMFYAATSGIREGRDGHRKEVEKFYKSYQRVLTREQGLSNEDPEFVVKVLGLASKVYGDDLEAMKIINSLVARDANANGHKLIQKALEFANIKGSAAYEREIMDWAKLQGIEGEEFARLWRDIRETMENFEMEEK